MKLRIMQCLKLQILRKKSAFLTSFLESLQNFWVILSIASEHIIKTLLVVCFVFKIHKCPLLWWFESLVNS